MDLQTIIGIIQGVKNMANKNFSLGGVGCLICPSKMDPLLEVDSFFKDLYK